MIDISKLSKAQVLAALYNASQPLGLGFLHYDPSPMSEDEAAKLLEESTYFDYLKGRVMKVDLSKSEFDPWLYDRDNGQGAAARVVGGLTPLALDGGDSAALQALSTLEVLSTLQGESTPAHRK